jgi:hypothetical protein
MKPLLCWRMLACKHPILPVLYALGVINAARKKYDKARAPVSGFESSA